MRTNKRNVAYGEHKISEQRVPNANDSGSGEAARFWGPWTVASCVLLGILTFTIYSSVRSQGFLLNWDDDGYISKNAHVKAGLTWNTVAWALTATEMGNWHPITWISHALDYQIFGDWAGGHHLIGVLLHFLNATILYLLLARATRLFAPSFFVAAFFAVHPLQVESVAWAAERKNLLCTFFFLLALAAYGWYSEKPSAARYLSVAGLFALGLGSKPMIVTFPFVLLLVDYWPLRRIASWSEPAEAPQRPWKSLLLEKVPLLAMSLASSLITMKTQTVAMVDAELLPFATRAENAILAYGMYVRNAFWPVGLAPVYYHAGKQVDLIAVALSAVFLLLVSLLAWYYRRTWPFLIVGWLWFLGTLVPVIGIVQVGAQSMADRYAYIPIIGVFTIFVWCGAKLAAARKSQPAFWALNTVLVGLLAVSCWRQLQYWKTPVDLWRYTLAVTKDNYAAENNLGFALLRVGNIEALEHFKNAARIAPTDPVSHGILGGYFQDQGKFQEALAYYQVALRSNDLDDLAVTETNMAILYRQIGDYAKAREMYQRALQSSPNAVDEFKGGLLQRLADQPSAQGYYNLGLLLDVANRLPEARAAYEQALSIDPALDNARQALTTLR
jgi:protein O-mannosyl-transferase